MIRLIEENDLSVVNEIYNQAVLANFQTADTEKVSKQGRLDWFRLHQNKKYPIFVIEEKNEVVGWASISAYRSGRKALRYTAEISYYIHKDFQNNGIGSRLLAFIINEAKKLDYRTLFAILLSPNKASIALLEKFDFQLWGTLENVADFDGVECHHLYYGLRIKN